MKIIIAGAGEVGFHLAKLLSYESQEIILIDLDKERLAYAETHLDIKVVKGDITSVSVLKESNIANADLFVSVTSSQTANITSCVLAKQLGAKRTIARISNTEFIEHKDEVGFETLGIDELISPESLASSEIELLLNQSVFNDTYAFEDGALTMLGLTLSADAKIIDKQVKVAAQLLSDIHFIPIAIQRYGSHLTLIPRGDTVFKEGDRVVFITSEGGDEELCKLTGKRKTQIKDIMILGGGQIGAITAKELSKTDFNIKIVEKSKERALELADQLSNALVINGDGRNVELLEEENINAMDAFISVTGNSETNIMSCLVAKSKGVKKTIALVENMDYFALSHSIGVDTLINKKLLAANSIFRYVRKGEVVAMTKLANMKAELLEFVVKPTSRICYQFIKEVDFPRAAIIGGVIRNESGIIALGDFKIEPGDRVVVCCLPEAISKVERLFF
ncbi:Trk system potassium uptake protein TrkA [Formosa sp. Hel3_A1_48]|jgi:trk system potassium uptake protein TrkA|uniref:Trk system potassium transporter TrkA n=1 Tax=Formosa sp. Hel3_A1_48 TaxID=1336795 RepID=UPI00084E0C11|nr:Trk system potassium transporter TrkA [Formosa sp. Hel3_A1_48]AOR25872.1 Trk system potassium uptake protein TrkA [Formosa sp. Hel3_A1_48]MDA9760924.1 Trk system potassium transporter TrkA [Flavobacteriaceae bacterium]MDG1056382.1 Trk system potassium transporter TrkA [Flavobacteriaceae bacterium]CAI8159947.1 MAG: Trk system potassium uptake protein TrkA [Formosa sp. Hel3_A1_48]